MTADILSNKKLKSVVTILCIKRGKLNTSIIFITESYFASQKNIRLNFIDHFITKISNKKRTSTIAFNHLSDIGFDDCMKINKNFSSTLSSSNLLRFRKILIKTGLIANIKIENLWKN